MSLEWAMVVAGINGDILSPEIIISTNYKHWITIQDWRRCINCAILHGKIWLISETPNPKPPLHMNCRCVVEPMKAIKAGTATTYGINGADWELKQNSNLPNYYITKEELQAKGWKSGKWPSNFAPDKMITAGKYYNDNEHLPETQGRVWYEADINYKSGKRNSQRIVWSNDGLVFVTYDHYQTFYEIV